jgi:hypothetical protein
MIRVNISREMAWLEDSDLKNYDVVVSSHILEGMTKRITSMFVKLKRPYVIDPHTYVFGADVEYIQERNWFDKLLGSYGLDGMIDDPNNFELLSSSLVDKNMQSTDNLKELVENVMNYQRTKIQDTYDDINEFEEFDGEDNEALSFKPKWIIPPYFFIQKGHKNWHTVNINSIKLAVENKNHDEKIFAVIMFDKELLPFAKDVDEIINEYNIEGVDGYMIWCAYFDENSAKERELGYFQNFIEKLAIHKKPIYNMYGGLFSFLLEDKGMMGVSHSICYGEHKIPFSTGGGGSTIRFYQPYLHSKVPLARMEEIENALELKKCDCKYCDSLKDERPESNELELTGKHFLLKRMGELEEINTHGTGSFLKKLINVNQDASQKDKTGAYTNLYDRFSVWNKTINKLN